MTPPAERAPPRERILLVQHDPHTLPALTSLLGEHDFEVVLCERAALAPQMVSTGQVDLVLLDVRSAPSQGLEVCRQIKSTGRGRLVPVLLVALQGSEAVAGLEAGADGYVLHAAAPTALVAQLRAMLRFSRMIAPGSSGRDELLSARIQALSSAAGLSEREREVLTLLLLGRNASEIGLALGISPRTAKFHQANVLTKVGAESRFDLLRFLF